MRQRISMGIPLILLGAMSATSGDNADRPPADPPLSAKQSNQTLAIVPEKTGATKKLPWKSVIGRRVTIQGIAWTGSKGLGDRVILDGTSMYVDTKAPFKEPGKLVEVTGTLAKRRVRGAPPGSQGFSHDTEYYTLEDATARNIESVAGPYVVVFEK